MEPGWCSCPPPCVLVRWFGVPPRPPHRKKTHTTAQICPPSTLQVHQSAVRTLLDTSPGCVPSASIMYTWTKTVSQGRFCAAEVVIKQPKNSPKSSSSSFQLQEMSNTCHLHSEASRSFCRHLIIRRRGSPVSCPSTPATIFISSPPPSLVTFKFYLDFLCLHPSSQVWSRSRGSRKPQN